MIQDCMFMFVCCQKLPKEEIVKFEIFCVLILWFNYKNLEFYVGNFDTWWIILFWYMWISLNIFICENPWISLFWLKKDILFFIFDLVKRISWYFINIISYRKLTYVCWFKELKLFMKYLIIIINLIDCRYVRGWWSCWFSCKILGKDIESLWLSFYIGKLL